MVRFSVDQIRSVMSRPERVRNMSVIAHVDHGKTTLTDSLVAAAGMMSYEDAGHKRALDTHAGSAERGITIKAASISLYHKANRALGTVAAEGDEFLINLIDSPGHVDFSSEVTAALRVTDGALVVIDCIEGVAVQTETVLRQALAERIVPILMVNKLDRAFLELQLDGERAYQSFARSIESVNAVIGTYQDPSLADCTVDPAKGTVAFGAGLHGWAFTLRDFARKLAPKFKLSESELMQKLWGDNFYDKETKEWTTSATSDSGKPLKRGFVEFVLDYVIQALRDIMSGDRALLTTWLDRLKVTLKGDEAEADGKRMMKSVMRRWLPAADALLEMIICFLPNPRVAQQYRADVLYDGDLSDKYAAAIRACDPEGPLIMYVSKMIPTKDNAHFIAFGRVFSGCVTAGTKVRILDRVPKNSNVQRVVVMMGAVNESVPDIPCGNVAGLIGVDKDIIKCATIVPVECTDASPLKAMKYSVSPVVRVAVRTKLPSEMPKLDKALKLLIRTDPLVVIEYIESTKEHIIAGAGELHLEIILNDLREAFLKDVEIVVGPPVVQFRETVAGESAEACLAKSANKHNRMWAKASPLVEGIVSDIIEGKIGERDDVKARAKILSDYGWDPTDARKLLAFGPVSDRKSESTCVFVDTTKAVQYLREASDSLIAGFQEVTSRGVLCDEPLHGVRFNLCDLQVHADNAHRGTSQVLPMSRRSLLAAQLTAQPRLLEPIFLVTISAPQECLGGIMSALSQRRGQIFAQEFREGTPMVEVKAWLPVAESFGFSQDLRQQTAGQAFPSTMFDHWQEMPGDPLDPTSLAGKAVRETRIRKQLKPEVPPLENFMDRM
eukprot:TRINITY_DN7091_c0_g1_i1.p1 TRINITY_DN7091_c0_g1~~TRINITY_DN7091_c0_g1_i1.p1  ORF type:complete len:839 (+),score=211.16 TRINITY_DN7091_c0_g1_i1:104-2620(+)